MLKYIMAFVGFFAIIGTVLAESNVRYDYVPYIRLGVAAGQFSEQNGEAFYELQESWMGTQVLTSTTGVGIGGPMKMKSDSTTAVTAGVGFDFGRVRMDFMYENRSQAYDATLRMYDKLGFNGSLPYTELNYDGDLASHLFMANFFLQGDRTPSGVIPYIGLGVGFAKHTLNDLVQHDDNPYADDQLNTLGGTVAPPVGLTGGDTDVDADINGQSTVWSFMAGLSLIVSENLMFDIGYRYIDLGDMTVVMNRYRAVMENPAAYESYREIKNHQFSNRVSEITAGIRFAF